jgi:hypothetical protein
MPVRGVLANLHILGIHIDRITRTRLHAHPAEDTLEQIYFKFHRRLLDLVVRRLAGHDLYTPGRAHGLAAETRHALARTVFAPVEPVPATPTVRDRPFLFRILDGHNVRVHRTADGRDKPYKVYHKMPGCDIKPRSISGRYSLTQFGVGFLDAITYPCHPLYFCHASSNAIVKTMFASASGKILLQPSFIIWS